MDWIKLRQKGREAFGKYKYGLLILALGLVMMLLPEQTEKAPQPIAREKAEEETVEARLEQVLGLMEGVGAVKVMLSQATGEEYLYQTNSDEVISEASRSRRSDTVIVSNEDRAESGLVRQVNPPGYLGAIIVCQGADRPSVCLAVIQAVADVTGLGSDCISVLKMK